MDCRLVVHPRYVSVSGCMGERQEERFLVPETERCAESVGPRPYTSPGRERGDEVHHCQREATPRQSGLRGLEIE